MTLYVAAGATGKLATSPDGVTWTLRTSSFGTTAIESVTYGNGLFVAVGQGGQVATSTDGVTWTQRTTLPLTPFAVAYGNGLFVVGGSAASGNPIYTSTDGVTWTQRVNPFGTSTVRGIAYGGGLWIAVGDGGVLATSPDAITWTSRTSGFGSTSINAVAYGGGRWVVVGSSSKIGTSTDGVTWSVTIVRDNVGNSYGFQAVAYDLGMFVIAEGATNFGTATSTDGSTWTRRNNLPVDGAINAMTAGSGVFLAVGAGTILRSTDGTTWTQPTSPFGGSSIYAVGGNPNSIPDSVGVLIG